MKVFGLVLLGCVAVALANSQNQQNPSNPQQQQQQYPNGSQNGQSSSSSQYPQQQQQQQQQQQWGSSAQNQNPEVQTVLGKIRGSVMQSRTGKTIYAYRGVRYAEAPTGEYRFRQAAPAKPYSQTLDASQDGPACPQPGNNRTQSEDCLRLNIYTRQSPSDSGSQQGNQQGNQQGQQGQQGNQGNQGYPSGSSSNQGSQSGSGRDVVVFFHPGGFYSYSGTSADFGPEYLLDHDIVLVTVNYRLGSLGFLSTGDSHAPGNAGLKDQVEALRYVQKNIAKFGGNPNSVTILGYSSGAWSVSLHLVSPMSTGLFHRAIAMSGAATYQNPLPQNQENLARKQAQLLGCPSDSHESLVNCLRSKPAEAFGNSVPQFAEWHSDPVLIWAPVVEPEIPGVERFLPVQPADLIREKKINSAPLLTGVNRDEFGGVIITPTEQALQGNSSIFDDINAHWFEIAPISFYYDRNGSRSSRISKELKSYYLRDQPVNPSNVRGLAQLYGDALIGFQSYRFAKLMAENSPQPVYNYHFVAEGRDSFAKWSNGSNYGVVHHDDLLYLFRVGNYPVYSNSDAREVKIVERYTSIVANFARYGQPIPSNNPNFANVNLQPSTASQAQYLEFDHELSVKSGYVNAPRMQKLEELFPLPAVGQSNDQSNQQQNQRSNQQGGQQGNNQQPGQQGSQQPSQQGSQQLGQQGQLMNQQLGQQGSQQSGQQGSQQQPGQQGNQQQSGQYYQGQLLNQQSGQQGNQQGSQQGSQQGNQQQPGQQGNQQPGQQSGQQQGQQQNQH